MDVYLDNKMTWKTHIEQITSKMLKTIGISRIKTYSNKHLLHTLYYTMTYLYLYLWLNSLGINLSIKIRETRCVAKKILA